MRGDTSEVTDQEIEASYQTLAPLVKALREGRYADDVIEEDGKEIKRQGFISLAKEFGLTDELFGAK